MGEPLQPSERAPGEGFLVLWLGGPGRWEPEVQAKLGSLGVRIVDSGLDVLLERANQRAPDLIVLTGAAASAPESVVSQLASSHPARSVPIVAIGMAQEARPSARARYGLVARLDRDAGADALTKQLHQLLRGLSKVAAQGRLKAKRGDLGVIVRRFTTSGRSGLLAAPGAGAIAIDPEGVSAPEHGVLLQALGAELLQQLTFYERAPGQIHIVRKSPRYEQTVPPFRGARVLVIDPEIARAREFAMRCEAAGAQSRATELVLEAIEAARSIDPTVVVVRESSLAHAACSPLWTEPRLASAALLILGDDLLEHDPANLLGPVSLLCSIELGLQKRLVRNEAIAERLETLGATRWLKVLGRCKHEVTFRVFAAAGRVRIDLGGGRVQGAAFRPSDSRVATIEGRAAVEMLQGLPFGRVLAGPAASLAALDGERSSRKLSMVGRVVPERSAAPEAAHRKGLVAEEIVVRSARRAPTPIHISRQSDMSLEEELDALRPPTERFSAPVPDMSDDLPTRNYTADAVAELQAELRKAAGVSERPPDPEPVPEPELDRSRLGERAGEPDPSSDPDRPSEPEPLSEIGDVSELPSGPPEPRGRPRPSGAGWFIAGATLAISVGAWSAWQLTIDAPPVATAELPGARRTERTTAPGPDVPDSDPVVGRDPAPDAGMADPDLVLDSDPSPDPTPQPDVDADPDVIPDPEAEAIVPPPRDATVGSLVEQSLEASRVGDHRQSEIYARQALAMEPAHGGAAYRLAAALYRQRRLEEATLWAERAAESDERQALPLALLGDIHMRSGRFRSAEAAYRASAALDPAFGPAQRGLDRLRARGRIE